MTTAGVVAGIAAGDDAASEEFYTMLREGFFRRAARQVGRFDAEDVLHDVYVICVETIRGGKLKQPQYLLAYAIQTGSHLIAHVISKRATQRRRELNMQPWMDVSGAQFTDTGDAISDFFMRECLDPEQAAIEHERADIIHTAIQCASTSGKSPAQSAILALTAQGHTREDTLQITGLNENQYRCCKSRATVRFLATAQRLIQRAPARRKAIAKAHAAAA